MSKFDTTLEELKSLCVIIPGVDKLLDILESQYNDLDSDLSEKRGEIRELREELEEREDCDCGDIKELVLPFGTLEYRTNDLKVQQWIDDISIQLHGHALS